MSRKEALDKARNAGLDLVEISPTATPPVAKIVDWGKYQYQKMKEQQRNKKNARSSEIKQMRLGLKIGQNDLNIKLRKIRKFLLDGDKVKSKLSFVVARWLTLRLVKIYLVGYSISCLM